MKDDINHRILYSSAEINRGIRQLFADPDITKKRIVIVAYIGRDATDFLPSPQGVRVICSPSPMATSFSGICALQGRGASVEFADGLHAKVYWSEGRGCVLTSANLSMRALGMGGLKEVGIFLQDTDFDIEALLKVVCPRHPTSGELGKLRKAEELAKLMIKRIGIGSGRETKRTTFLDWYKNHDQVNWKLGWWTISAPAAKEAKSKSYIEYGVKSPAEHINCAPGTILPNEWVLMVELTAKSAKSIQWMFSEFIVRVKKTERGIFEKSYPNQAVQPLPSRRYHEPPFLIDTSFRSALRAAIKACQPSTIMNRKSLVPTSSLLDETYTYLKRG